MTFVTLWTPDPPTAAGAPGTGVPNGGAFAPLLARLLAVTPHAVLAPAEGDPEGGTYVWADGRGLSARRVAREVLRHARERGVARPRVGVARVAVVAAVAARWGAHRAGPAGAGASAPLTGVAPNAERAFLAPHPLAVLLPSVTADDAGGTESDRASPTTVARAMATLADVGVVTCGALARIARESVEVRLGAAGVALWRLARADDARRVFRYGGHALPSASLEWNEFDLREPERLLFVAGRLVARVCGALRARGEGAGAMTLALRLAGGGAVERRVRAARDTADPATWRRLLRAELERVELSDAVSGLALRVETARALAAPQADLFDRGGQTATAAAAAVARLIEDGAGRPVRPVTGAHPLPERRLTWEPTTVEAATRAMEAQARRPALAVREGPPGDGSPAAAPRLTLHVGGAGGGRATSTGAMAAERTTLGIVRAPAPGPDAPEAAQESMNLRVLPRPRPLAVTTRPERGHPVPVRYRERLAEGARAPHGIPLVEVLTAAGPDRVTAGAEHGVPASREYWQCLTGRGDLVLLYRDLSAAEGGAADAWFLHGWWD
ncbi:hypothetical protein tb265_34580 [Gemmatimonadetes bacterium T265]|nr:hypothetical protein tb265_34580 [Gemmatimonadetes bacterium T265]